MLPGGLSGKIVTSHLHAILGERAAQRCALLQAEECSVACSQQGPVTGLWPHGLCVTDPPWGPQTQAGT